MRVMTQAAPAKLNLALEIRDRRPDGYHNLCSVMQTVSLCDTVTVEERRSGFTLRVDGEPLHIDGQSLEQRAAEAFFRHLGRPVPGLAVTLEKRTPAYAGLVGGSADVAALLRILRAWYCPEMPAVELEAIGLTVGSDMPFCVRGGTALAEGRGEILTDLPLLPRCWLVLCKPDFGIPTPELFARADAQPVRCRPDIAGMRRALEQGDLDGVAARLCNGFEALLPPEYHAVFRIRDRLRELGALNAAMSGSGPTVFGMFREREAAENAATSLRREYAQTYLAEPVGRLEPRR